jgi:hypothetical protein
MNDNAKWYIFGAAILVYTAAVCIVWNSIRPERVVDRPSIEYRINNVPGKTVYVPNEAKTAELGEWQDWAAQLETEWNGERDQKRAMIAAWVPLASDSALSKPPFTLGTDDVSDGLLFAELDRHSIARPLVISRPEPPAVAPKVRYKRGGFCFIPGISAGLESRLDPVDVAPVGYFDVEYLWWYRFNLAAGINTESVKFAHLRYRLPLFTDNLMLGVWGSSPYGKWEPKLGVGASVGF